MKLPKVFLHEFWVNKIRVEITSIFAPLAGFFFNVDRSNFITFGSLKLIRWNTCFSVQICAEKCLHLIQISRLPEASNPSHPRNDCVLVLFTLFGVFLNDSWNQQIAYWMWSKHIICIILKTPFSVVKQHILQFYRNQAKHWSYLKWFDRIYQIYLSKPTGQIQLSLSLFLCLSLSLPLSLTRQRSRFLYFSGIPTTAHFYYPFINILFTYCL